MLRILKKVKVLNASYAYTLTYFGYAKLKGTKTQN